MNLSQTTHLLLGLPLLLVSGLLTAVLLFVPMTAVGAYPQLERIYCVIEYCPPLEEKPWPEPKFEDPDRHEV